MPSLKIAGSVAFVTLALQGCGDKAKDPAQKLLDDINAIRKCQKDAEGNEKDCTKLKAEQCTEFATQFLNLEKPSDEKKPSEKKPSDETKPLKDGAKETEKPYFTIQNFLSEADSECKGPYEEEKKIQDEAATLKTDVEAAKADAKADQIPDKACTDFNKTYDELSKKPSAKTLEKVKKDLAAAKAILDDKCAAKASQ